MELNTSMISRWFSRINMRVRYNGFQFLAYVVLVDNRSTDLTHLPATLARETHQSHLDINESCTFVFSFTELDLCMLCFVSKVSASPKPQTHIPWIPIYKCLQSQSYKFSWNAFQQNLTSMFDSVYSSYNKHMTIFMHNNIYYFILIYY